MSEDSKAWDLFTRAALRTEDFEPVVSQPPEPLVKRPYGEDELKPYSTWKHVKTNSLYTVLGVALCSTNGQGEHHERAVVYVSHAHQGLRYRGLEEFLDGRFIPL